MATSQLITLQGLNDVWTATKGLYNKNLNAINNVAAHVNDLYVPAVPAQGEEGDPGYVPGTPASGAIAQEISRLDGRINNLDFEASEITTGTASSNYISSVTQANGKVVVSKVPFETSITFNNPSTTNAPTAAAVVNLLKSLKFIIRNNSNNTDATNVTVQLGNNTDTITLVLPSKVYGAAFN